MRKGSKHTAEARERIRQHALAREAPVAQMSRRLKDLEAWCQKYPNAYKAIELQAQNGRDWARDLLTILRHPT